jgi:hypothetical protein
MKEFKLSKQSVGATITKFFVYDGASIIGSINVQNEDARDLERHWLGGTTQAQSSASIREKENALVSKMMEAGKRSNAPVPAAADTSKRNPMIDVMLAIAPRNRLSRQAILRG